MLRYLPKIFFLCLLFGLQLVYAQSPTVQDCPGAIPICDTIYHENNAYSGTGNIPFEINPAISCLGSGEKNDVWYIFTVQTPGVLNFSITPNNLADDYDWAVYNLTTATCAQIASNPAISVSCNYSGNPGVTGPNGLPGVQNNPPVPVLPGQTYVINVSQFSPSINGYTINFGASTASIYDNIPPSLSSITSPLPCGRDSLVVTFTENVQCNSIQPTDFVINGPAGTVLTVTSVLSNSCASGAPYGKTYRIHFTPPISLAGSYNLTVVDTILDLCDNAVPIPTNFAFIVNSIVLTQTKTNVTCPGGNNGTATTNIVIGGTPPYSFLWSNGQTSQTATGLAAGTYTVIVTPTGNACATPSTFIITQPPAYSITSNITGSGCGTATGSIQLTNVTGGLGPYTYLWSNSTTNVNAVNLAAATYTVTITDANLCTYTSSFVVSTTNNITSSVNAVQNVSCLGGNNGSATASALNGSGSYSYLWSNAATTATVNNFTAGIFTVTVTDLSAGCTATSSVTITQPASAIGAGTNSFATSCNLNNGSVSVVANGGTGGYTYLWNTGNTNAVISNIAGAAYTVTVTDFNGCTVSVSAVVASSTAPVLNTTSLNNVSCFGGTNGSVTINCTGCTGATTYLWNNGNTTSALSNVIAGNYTVTITDASNCTASLTMAITQPLQLISNAIPNDTVCTSNAASLIAVVNGGTLPYSYLWSNGQTNATLSLVPISTSNYTVVITDAHNCTSTQSAQIYVRPPLNITVSNDTTICEGGSALMIAGATGGDGNYLYNWNSGLGFGNTITVSPTSSFVLTVNVTDGCGSPSGSISTNVFVVPTIASSFAGVSDVKCFGGNDGIATAIVSSGGQAPFNYLWSNSTSTATNSNLASGTYTVTITDFIGCSTTASLIINQPAVLIANPIVNDTICISNVSSLTASASGGTISYNYQWSNGTTDAMMNDTPIISTTYTVTITDANNCTASQTAMVIVRPPLSLTVSNDTTICKGATITVIANATGGDGNFIYNWNNIATTKQISLTPLSDTTLNVLVTDGCGSPQVTKTIHVTVVPDLQLSITKISDVNCFGGSNGKAEAIINSGGLAPFNYQWSNGNSTAINSNLVATAYIVTVTDAIGCSATAGVFITEPTLITLTVTSNMLICNGRDTTLTAITTGGIAPYNYNWSTGATGSALLVNPNITSTYTITVTDNNGCTKSNSSVVKVLPPLTITNITASQDLCNGQSINISASANGGNGNYTYSWNNGLVVTQTFSALPATDTTYIVTISDGCTIPDVSDSVRITVIDAPEVNFGYVPEKGCQPLLVTFTDSTKTVIGSTYLWQFGNGNTSTVVNPIQIYKNYGLFDVTLTVTTPQGCKSTLTKAAIINVYEKPSAIFNFEPTQPTLYTPTIYFNDNSTGINSIWYWEFGDGDNSTAQNPQHNYKDTGTYKILFAVTNNEGCTDTTTYLLHIKDEYSFYIPNAFTPNGNGVNDYFTLSGINFKSFEVQIFNRFGQTIFKSANKYDAWDGNDSNGKAVQQGAYAYQIIVTEPAGKRHTYTGTVDVIR